MKQRIFWLDSVRAIAIVLVVFTHIHENVGIDNYLLKSFFYNIDRLGVPIFFMLSGGLILPKLVSVNYWSFYKKRIPQFFLLLIFYSISTTAINRYLSTGDFYSSLKFAISTANGVYPAKNGNAHQLWFMYTIIQLYLIAPFLARFVDKLPTKDILFFIGLCVLFGQLKGTLATKFDISLLNCLGQDFLGAFLPYFLFGYVILNRRISMKTFYAFSLFILPIVIVMLREWHHGSFIGAYHWYSSSISIVLSSFGLIFLLKNYFENSKENKIFSVMSKYSFGIYLSHFAFIYIFRWLLKGNWNGFSLSFKLVILFTLTFITSLLFSWLLSKNKYTKYLVQ